MALPPTELRYRKAIIWPMLGINFIVIVVVTWMTFGGLGIINWRVILGWLSVVTIILWMCFYFYKLYSSNRPVITFHSTGMVLHRKGDKYIAWDSILEWRMRQDKSSYYLVIITREGKTRVGISMLDRRVKQIEELVRTYIRQPGPFRP